MESNEKIDMVIHKAVTSALQEQRDKANNDACNYMAELRILRAEKEILLQKIKQYEETEAKVTPIKKENK